MAGHAPRPAFVVVGDDAMRAFKPVADPLDELATLHVVRSMVELESALTTNPRSILVGDAKAVLAQRSLLGNLRRVLLVPMVFVNEGPVPAPQQQLLRAFGGNWVLDTTQPTPRDIEALVELARSARAPLDLERLPLGVLLERLAGSKATAQITIACPHSPVLWLSNEPPESRPCVGQSTCGGWYGTVVVRGGVLVHCETGAGIYDKLAKEQVLSVTRGYSNVSAVFLLPRTPQVRATATTATQAVPPPPRKDEAQMSELDKVLKVASGLRGIARSNASGGIEEFTGQLDAESVCAVAAMCSQHLAKISELLGCGDLVAWALTTEASGFYVHQSRDGLVAIVGEANKNPDTVLRKTGQALKGA